MKRSKILFCIIMVFLIITKPIFITEAYAQEPIIGYSDGCRNYIFSDSSYFYAVACTETAAVMQKLNFDGNYSTAYNFECNGRIIACDYKNGKFYILCSEYSEKAGKEVGRVYYGYNFGDDMSSVTIMHTIRDNSTFCVDAYGNMYYNSSESKALYVRLSDGSESRVGVDNFAFDIVSYSNDKLIYATTAKGIYFIEPENSFSVSFIKQKENNRYSRVVFNDKLYFGDGFIFSLKDGKKEIYPAGVEFPYADNTETISYDNSTCIVANGNSIYKVNPNEGGSLLFNTEGHIFACEINKDCILTLERGNNSIFVRHYYIKSNSTQSDNNKHTDSTLSQANNEISSDTSEDSPFNRSFDYSIDENKKCIFNIPADTTVSKLKVKLNLDAYKLTVKNCRGIVTKTGKLGSNSTVILSKKGKTVKYYISVNGDLTGEGNVNSNDLKALSNVMLSGDKLDFPFMAAGDINKDSTLDTVDLLRLHKNICNNN